MLSTEELDDLAADIAERGLLHAIVLDKDGLILDGRNRLEACKRAKVEPVFETYEGDDPAGYALSVNIARRHLSKGQIAMIAAKARLVSNRVELWLRPTREVAEEAGTSQTRVVQAAVVMEYAPELVDQVIAGGSLDDAYRIARERKEALEQERRQLTGLRARHRDLALQVDASELTLGQALAAAEAIEDEAAREEETARWRLAVELALEEIGPEVPIPEPPNLSLQLERPAPASVAPALATGGVRQQEAFLRGLIDVRERLQSLLEEEPAESWWPEGQVTAVRSAVSHIVVNAYAIADNAMPQGPRILPKK
jgi:ParB-like chromosome segregation protein Spo0J